VLGTERHEARRIDNQLRGRSGRQGDPGESQFFISLEDELMRIFGGDTIKKVLTTLKIDENEPIEHPLISRAIEGAQKKVEAYNFNIRKNLLEYDNVLEKQREVIYSEREKIFKQESIKEEILDMLTDIVEKVFEVHYPESGEFESEEARELENALSYILNRKIQLEFADPPQIHKEEILERLKEFAVNTYEEKENHIGSEIMRSVEKYILLRSIDSNWKDHLYTMDDLKEGVGLRAYGQQEPLIAYQIEGHKYFDDMMERIKEDTITTLFKIEIRREKETKPQENPTLSKDERRKKREQGKKLKKKRKL